MASTWSNLGLRLMATGENDGTWGAQTNDNLNRIEDAISGFATVAVSGNTSLTFTTQPTSYVDENGRNKILVFTDTSWTSATFTTRGALIYNTNDSNSAVMVIDFGGDYTVTGGTFTIAFPAADASNAIIRIA